MRRLFITWATAGLLIAGQCGAEQMTFDFGSVWIGDSSRIEIYWAPPHLPGTIRVDNPVPPFYLTGFGVDSSARIYIGCLFAPENADTVSAAPIHCTDPNGNPIPYGLILHGQGVASNLTPPHSPPLSSLYLAANPNPCNSFTNVTIELPRAGRAKLRAYNSIGQEVCTLQNGTMTAGEHRVLFDGGQLPAGIYFLRLDAASHQRTLKLVLLK